MSDEPTWQTCCFWRATIGDAEKLNVRLCHSAPRPRPGPSRYRDATYNLGGIALHKGNLTRPSPFCERQSTTDWPPILPSTRERSRSRGVATVPALFRVGRPPQRTSSRCSKSTSRLVHWRLPLIRTHRPQIDPWFLHHGRGSIQIQLQCLRFGGEATLHHGLTALRFHSCPAFQNQPS